MEGGSRQASGSQCCWLSGTKDQITGLSDTAWLRFLFKIRTLAALGKKSYYNELEYFKPVEAHETENDTLGLILMGSDPN